MGVLSSCHSDEAGTGSDATAPLVTNLSAAVDRSARLIVIIFLGAAAAAAIVLLIKFTWAVAYKDRGGDGEPQFH